MDRAKLRALADKCRTCSGGVNLDSDYTPDELEFLKSMDWFKREFKRPHPTWREVMAVFLELGYRKS